MVQKRTPPEHTPPGHPEHPEHPEADDRPEHERADDGEGDSETLALLRVRVHEDYARRQQYGLLGRSL